MKHAHLKGDNKQETIAKQEQNKKTKKKNTIKISATAAKLMVSKVIATATSPAVTTSPDWWLLLHFEI